MTIDVDGKRRCDASNLQCQKLAHWEIQASSGTYLHYCTRHKESRREPEHFRRAVGADWRSLKTV